MKNNILFISLIMLLLFVNLIACAQQEEKNTMTVTELKEKAKNNNLVILDVRTEEELTGPLGHIEGIVHIPLHELKNRINELDKFSDKEIAVVCRSGNRSNTATNILRMNGFDAKNVEGGMIEYRRLQK